MPKYLALEGKEEASAENFRLEVSETYARDH